MPARATSFRRRLFLAVTTSLIVEALLALVCCFLPPSQPETEFVIIGVPKKPEALSLKVNAEISDMGYWVHLTVTMPEVVCGRKSAWRLTDFRINHRHLIFCLLAGLGSFVITFFGIPFFDRRPDQFRAISPCDLNSRQNCLNVLPAWNSRERNKGQS
jgi:hypothetical protein